MLFIRSTGTEQDGSVVWNVEGELIDFSAGELEELVRHIRTTGLFSYLAGRRPALRHQLLTIFAQAMREHELEERDLEQLLEARLLDLAQRVGVA